MIRVGGDVRYRLGVVEIDRGDAVEGVIEADQPGANVAGHRRGVALRVAKDVAPERKTHGQLPVMWPIRAEPRDRHRGIPSGDIELLRLDALGHARRGTHVPSN